MSSSTYIAPDWLRRIGVTTLWSEITPGLAQGGTEDDDVLGAMAWRNRVQDGVRVKHVEDRPTINRSDFDAVVTLYVAARPVGNGVEEYRWHILDDVENPFTQDVETVREVVAWAHRRWVSGKRVLIRCQAGLNRSGMITALVLVRGGMEPQEAIDKVRRMRSRKAVFNEHFERFILETPAETWRD